MLAIAVELVMLLWPVSGAISLTLLLTVFFILDGIASIMYALAHRRELTGRWGWLLAGGLIDLTLAVLIILGYSIAADPSGAGCSALFAGFPATMTRPDFSAPCIIGYGSSPSRCGPSYSVPTRHRWPDPRPPRFRCDPFARDVAFDPGRADNFRVIVRKDGPRVKLYSGRARPIVETRIISG